MARKVGLPLILAGIIHDEDYFRSQVAPYLDDKWVRYIGPVGPERRSELLGRARALIHPINFNEPFGFSVVEAMACGTPVIAMRRGAMPELIDDGVTGFLVDTVEEAAQRVGEVSTLDRHRCRAWVEERFSQERMVREYLRVYETILKDRGVQ